MALNLALNLPVEIYQNIVPFLDYKFRTLCYFAAASKGTTDIIRRVATALGDRNLAGQPCLYPYNKNRTAKECVYQILKMHVLDTHPVFLLTIEKVRKVVNAKGKDLNDIASLLEHGVIKREDGCLTVDELRLTEALVPFDFHTKQITNPEAFTHVLTNAIFYKDSSLPQLVFAHPNSKEIEGLNLGTVLGYAADKKDEECLQLTRSHPKANTCPANGMYGLSVSLSNVCYDNNLKLTKIVLSFPNAKDIAANTDPDDLKNTSHSLVKTLGDAVRNKNPKLILKVISHPKAKEMSLDHKIDLKTTGYSYNEGLKHVLNEAVETKDPLVIMAVLHHPRIHELAEEDLYRAGTAMISKKDIEIFSYLNRMLETSNPNQIKLKEFRKTFRHLSLAMRKFVFVMLCKTHGRPSGKVDRDGIHHLAANPHSLLPILKTLTKYCWETATPGD